MQNAIDNLITKSSEMGAAVERAEIFAMVLEKMHEAITKDNAEALIVLKDILDVIGSRVPSNTTSDTTKDDN
jgi:hypothetical protein